MGDQDDESDVLYEMDEKGQQVVVKSIESNARAYLRFTNRTSHPVDVWWRDFHGEKRHYVRLEPGSFFDINSFVTHPWHFSDTHTKETYVINNKPIFRAPRNIGGMTYRTNWNITIGVRCLRYTALLVLAEHITDSNAVSSLGLPRVLTQELKKLVSMYHKPRTPPRRD